MGAEQSTTASAIEQFSSNNAFFKNFKRDRRLSLDVVELPGKISQISESDFDGIEEIESISLESRGIERLFPGTFRNLINLKRLNLENNHLTDLPLGLFASLRNLEFLNLVDNEIERIEVGTFEGLEKLQILDLRGKLLSSIKEGVFNGLHNLEKLNLSGNALTSIPSRSFKGLVALRELNLAKNQIKILEPSCFESLNTLCFLDLRDNEIEELHPGCFDGLTCLEILHLDRNLLTRIKPGSFHGLSALKKLVLTRNRIVDFYPRCFKELEELELLILDNNKLQSIEQGDFDGLHNIIELSLCKNPLKKLKKGAFFGLKSLQSLKLSETELLHVSPGMFMFLPSLSDLDLSRGSIGFVEPGGFSGLNNLRRLNLAQNTLKSLEEGAFEGLYNVEELTLSNNLLSDLHSQVFISCPSIKTLLLKNNSFKLTKDMFESLCSVLKHLLIIVGDFSDDSDTVEYMNTFHVIVVKSENDIKSIKHVSHDVVDITRLTHLLKVAEDLRIEVRKRLEDLELKKVDVDEDLEFEEDDDDFDGVTGTSSTKQDSEVGTELRLQKLLDIKVAEEFICYKNIQQFLEIIQVDSRLSDILNQFDLASMQDMTQRLQTRMLRLDEEVGLDYKSSEKILRFRQVCSYLIFQKFDSRALDFFMMNLSKRNVRRFSKGLFVSALRKYPEILDAQRPIFLEILKVLAFHCEDNEVLLSITSERAIKLMEPDDIKDLSLNYIKGSLYPLNASLRTYQMFLEFAGESYDERFNQLKDFFMDMAHDLLVEMPSDQMAALLMMQKDTFAQSALDFAFANNVTVFFSHPKVKKVFTIWLEERNFMKLNGHDTLHHLNEVSSFEKAIWNTRRYFTTPIVKFAVRVTFSIAFLLLFIGYLYRTATVDRFQDGNKDGIPDHLRDWDVLELILYIFAVSILLEEFSQLKELKSKYFESGWNVLDMVILVLFMIMFSLRLVMWTISDELLRTHWDELDVTFSLAAGTCMIIMCVRFLNVFRFNRNFGPLLRILFGMFTDIRLFFVLFFIILLGYSFAFLFLLRGQDIDGYTSLQSTFSTLFFTTFNEFDSGVFFDSNGGSYRSYAAYVLFCVYIINFYIVFMNLIIAMMSTTYARVRDDSNAEYMFLRCQLIEETHLNPAVLPPPATLFVFSIHYSLKLLTPIIRAMFIGRPNKIPRFWQAVCGMTRYNPERQYAFKSHYISNIGTVSKAISEAHDIYDDSSDDLNDEFDVKEYIDKKRISKIGENLYRESTLQLPLGKLSSARTKRDWWCQSCKKVNSGGLFYDVWFDYLEGLTKGYTKDYKKFFPLPQGICFHCNQMKIECSHDIIAKQIISRMIWTMLVTVPLRFILFIPRVLQLTNRRLVEQSDDIRVKKPTKKIRPENTQVETRANDQNDSEQEGIISIFMEEDKLNYPEGKQTVVMHERSANDPAVNELLTKFRHFIINGTAKAQKITDESLVTLENFKNLTNAWAEFFPSSKALVSAGNQLVSCILAELWLPDYQSSNRPEYAATAFSKLVQHMTYVITVMSDELKPSTHGDKRTASGNVEAYLCEHSLSICHNWLVTFYNDLQSSTFISELHQQSTWKALLVIASDPRTNGILSNNAWKLLRSIARILEPFEIPHFVALLMSIDPKYHYCLEDLLHTLCRSQKSFANEMPNIIDHYFCEMTGLKGNELDFAGVIDSLVSNVSSSYIPSGRVIKGSVVDDINFEQQYLIVKSNPFLSYVEVCRKDNISKIDHFKIENLMHSWTAEIGRLWQPSDSFRIKDGMINGLRKLLMQANSSNDLDADALRKMRTFTTLLSSVVTVILRNRNNRRSLVSNPSFLKIISGLLKYGPSCPLKTDITFDFVESREDYLHHQTAKLPLTFTMNDDLQMLEFIMKQQANTVNLLLNCKNSKKSIHPFGFVNVLPSAIDVDGGAGKGERVATFGISVSAKSDFPLGIYTAVVDEEVLVARESESISLERLVVKTAEIDDCDQLIVHQSDLSQSNGSANPFLKRDRKSIFVTNNSMLVLRVNCDWESVDWEKMEEHFAMLGILVIVLPSQGYGKHYFAKYNKKRLLVLFLEVDQHRDAWVLTQNIYGIPRLFAPSMYMERSVAPPDWAVWETGHPYKCSDDQRETITLTGAKRLLLLFHGNTCTEEGKDWLKIFRGRNEDEPLFDGEALSGDYENFRAREPIIVEGDTVSFLFHSDESRNFWGIQVYIKALSDQDDILYSNQNLPRLLTPFDFVGSMDYSHWRVWETEHPYQSNMDIKTEITIPNSDHLVVLFDPNCQLEPPHDWLKFYKGKGDNAIALFDAKEFSGSFGELLQHQPIRIPGNSLTIEMKTDYSTAFWGMRMYVYGARRRDERPLNFDDHIMYSQVLGLYYHQNKSKFRSDYSNERSQEISLSSPDIRYAQAPEIFSRSDYRVWETAHPYKDNTDHFETVRIAGAKKLVLTFDRMTSTEPPNDWLKVYAGASMKNPLWGDTALTGNYYSGFRPKDNTVILGDSVSFFFHSDSSNPFWGIRCYIRGIMYGDEQPLCTQNLELLMSSIDAIRGIKSGLWSAGKFLDWDFLGPNWRVWETAHPYKDSWDIVETVTIPGSSRLIVVFDPLCKTEQNFDWLKLFKGAGESVPLFNGDFLSGDFASGFADKDPLYIDGDSVTIRFHSDEKSAEWGVRLFIRGISDKDSKIVSPKPFSSSTQELMSTGSGLRRGLPVFSLPKQNLIIQSDREFSFIYNSEASLPISMSIPDAYVFELFERTVKIFKKARINIPSDEFEMKYLNEMMTAYRSGCSWAPGFFVFQRLDHAKESYMMLMRMISYLRALTILGLTVPDISKEELKPLSSKIGKSGSMFLKLIWCMGKNGNLPSNKIRTFPSQ